MACHCACFTPRKVFKFTFQYISRLQQTISTWAWPVHPDKFSSSSFNIYISRLSWKTQPKLGLSLCMFYTQKSFQVHISIHFKITTKNFNLSLARPPRLSPMSPKAWPRFTPLPSNLQRILTEFIAQWILTEYRSMNINRISLNEY